MYYIIDYIVKDPVEVAAAMVLIEKARIKAIRFGSIAEDKGTDMREAMNFIMKLVNLYTGAKEIPGSFVAMMLNGRSRYASNHSHSNLNVTGAVNYVRHTFGKEAAAYDVEYTDEPVGEEGGGGGNSDSDGNGCAEEGGVDADAYRTVMGLDGSGDGDEVDDGEGDEQVEYRVEIAATTETTDKNGTADVYKVGGEKRAVLFPDVYNFRMGDDMKRMSLYEFEGCVELQRRKGKWATWEEEVEEIRDDIKRKNNYWIRLHTGCPLYESHRLALRSKQVVPRLGIGPPPRLPKGSRPAETGKVQKEWDQKASIFAAYMLVLFKPWGYDNPLTDLSWRAYTAFCSELEQSKRVEDRFRLRVMENIAGENLVDAVKKKVLGVRRGENATRWNTNYGAEEGFMRLHDRTKDGKVPPKPGNKGSGAVPMVLPGNVAKLLEEEDLDDLMTGPGQDVVYERKMSLYIESTRAALSRAFYDRPYQQNCVPLDSPEMASPVLEARCSHQEVVDKIRVMKPRLEPLKEAVIDGADDESDREGVYEHPRRVGGGGEGGKFDELRFMNGNVPPTFSRLPESLQVDELNEDQRDIFDICTTYFRRLNRYKKGLRGAPVPKPKILLHGPPGTGKTHTMLKIMKAAEMYGFRCLAMAYQGSAASNLPGGLTINHFARVSVGDTGEGHHGIVPMALSAIREVLKDVRMILIDEIGMVPPRLLYRLHQVLQQATGNKQEAFGGLSVLTMGKCYL